MRKINGKEVLYSTTFALESGEKASLSPAELQGAGIEVHAVEKVGEPHESDIKIATAGNVATISIPFLKFGSLITGLSIGEMRDGKVSGRLVGQAVTGGMLVHLDVYLERTPYFGAR